MDPHSTKRPRIMPPEGAPNRPSKQNDHSHAQQAPFPKTSTFVIGQNYSSAVRANTATFSPLNRDGSGVLRGSHSTSWPKEALFHKDSHHQGTAVQPSKEQQQQPKVQQHHSSVPPSPRVSFRRQLQLQQAHQEFHRQRELYQTRQQQHQHPHEHSPQICPNSSTSTSNHSMQSDNQTPHHHHHYHHHHYHVLPVTSSLVASSPPPYSNSPQPQSYAMPITIAPSCSNSEGSLSSIPCRSLLSEALQHHHHYHNHHNHHHHASLHQRLPSRPNQFSEWTNVKEKERARLLSNMARVRESQTPLPSADTAKENLKRLSQRIHQRRTRARETILFDLHQGVKTVEAQVHKQVDMVMSRLKDAPGSKYAFALTHTFLTQLPQALSNTILPSAFSAVADTVASRTTNSMTTLRGAAGEDEYDEEEEEDEEENADDQDDPDEYQQQASIRMQLPQQDSRLSLQLSSEFGTIALAKEPRTVLSQRSAASSITTFGNNNRDYNNSRHLQEAQLLNDIRSGGVSISSAGASEFLAASTQHNYSSAASQVLAAALPSFIPSMVAPIVCVFSYPSPPTTIPNSPNQSSPSSPNMPTAQVGVRDRQESDASVARNLREFSPSEDVTAARELKEAIKTDPAVAEVTATTWTKAEQEALFLVATRFRLRGQWSKIRQVMNLHRTETEIADEYRRLYGDEDSGSDEDMTSEGDDGDLVPVKREGNVEDGDADDEADVVFMRFGGKHYPNPSYRRHCIDELPSTHSMIAVSSEPRSFGSYRSEYLSGPRGPVLANDHSSPASSQNSLRVIKKEFMIDKRFTLEDIPTRL